MYAQRARQAGVHRPRRIARRIAMATELAMRVSPEPPHCAVSKAQERVRCATCDLDDINVHMRVVEEHGRWLKRTVQHGIPAPHVDVPVVRERDAVPASRAHLHDARIEALGGREKWDRRRRYSAQVEIAKLPKSVIAERIYAARTAVAFSDQKEVRTAARNSHARRGIEALSGAIEPC